jgi:glycosyltransferase involved in cell wall biosynthesis
VVSGFHTNFHTYLQSYHLGAFERPAEALLAAVHNQTFRTLTPSRHTAELLGQMGVLSVAVLGRGVDAELFQPAARDAVLRQQWGADAGTPVVLHVGRLAEEKNLPLLERAMATFSEVHPGAKCVVVGDGPSAETLRHLHSEWIFTGQLAGAELARHYASADVFLFPSLTETFGNVVTEAMASGLLTVAFDYAAAHEHIRHGENGLVCPRDDADAFLKITQEAAKLWDNTRIRSEARATASSLSWASITRAFEQHLADAIHHQTLQQPPGQDPVNSLQ